MHGKYDVYILEVDGEYRVRPAVMAVTHGNGIKVCNLTDFDITIEFELGLLKPITVPQTVLTQIPAPARQQLVQLLPSPTRVIGPHSDDHYQFAPGKKGKAFDYKVEVQTTDGPVVAKGESGPKIIVDP
jgi:hypothetical protein